MASSLSSKKRIRENITRATRNRNRKSQVKNLARKFTDAIKAQNLGEAEQLYRQLTKRVDQFATTSTYHKNKVARIKSRFAKKLNDAKAQPA